MGGIRQLYFAHDRVGATARLSAIALLHSRRDHRGGFEIGRPVGRRREGDADRPGLGRPVPGWASNTFILDVVSAGVRVFMYEKGYLHAKTISIDSEICSIGSANIDIRSFSINYEINAVLYSRQLARELEEAFERDLADCTEFDAVEYSRKNPAARFRTRWRACSLRCSSWASSAGTFSTIYRFANWLLTYGSLNDCAAMLMRALDVRT